MATLIRFQYHPFDRLFDDAFTTRSWPASLAKVRRVTGTTNVPQRPRMDVTESKDADTVTATFELPGLKPEDVSIELQQDRLTVSGKSDVTHSHEEDAGYAVRERRHGQFSRTLQLPFGTKPEDVKAKLENGLLAVTFPKSTPEQLPHRITIQ